MERFTSNKESGTIRCTICGGLISGELTYTGDNYCKGHENKQLNIGIVRLSFDEIYHFNQWLTKNNWYEACAGEYDNHEAPNSCIRLTYEELYKAYLNES